MFTAKICASRIRQTTTDEAHLPAQRRIAETHAWISKTHVHSERSQGSESSPSKGSQASRGIAVHLLDEQRPGSRFSFRRNRRMTEQHQFERVLREPDSVFRAFPVRILSKQNDSDHSRLGLIVPKRNCKLSTQRNLVKRTIREWFRLRVDPIEPIDMVVLVAKLDSQDGASKTSVPRIRRALRKWRAQGSPESR